MSFVSFFKKMFRDLTEDLHHKNMVAMATKCRKSFFKKMFRDLTED